MEVTAIEEGGLGGSPNEQPIGGSTDERPPLILTQQDLIRELRKFGIVVSSGTVHAWVYSGCPTVPGWKRPRFILAKVIDWLHSDHELDPIGKRSRDALYKRKLKGVA